MEQERLPIVQEMILAKSNEERQVALDQLLPFQRSDFKGIFEAMVDPKTGDGYPVVIRLIDPPLHEFLPSYEDLLVEVTRLETQGGHEQELAEKKAHAGGCGSHARDEPHAGPARLSPGPALPRNQCHADARYPRSRRGSGEERAQSVIRRS